MQGLNVDGDATKTGQLKRVKRSSEIKDATRQCSESVPYTVTSMECVEEFSEESFGKTVLSDKLLSEDSSGRTFGRTVLSRELSLEGSEGRTSLESSVGRTFGRTVLSRELSLESSEERTSLESSVGRTFGRTVLSRELSLESSEERTSLESSVGRALGVCASFASVAERALQADTADTSEEYSVMAITIISAQFPTLCGHPPVTHTDSEIESESDGDSSDSPSDSVFYTRTTSSPLGPSSSLLATSSPLGPSSSLLATSSPLGPSSNLFGSMTSTEMAPAPQVASEADFDTEETNKAVDAANATKIKDQIEDGGKASDGNQIDDGAKDTDANQLDDGAKATDANQLDDGAKSSDVNTANSKSIVNTKASEAKDVVDKKGNKEKKTSAEADDQDWGNWQRSWDKKTETQSLSYNAKKN